MNCKAITKNGKPCARQALPGSEYCQVPSHQLLAIGDEAKVTDRILVPEAPQVVETINACGYKNVHAVGYDLLCDLEKNHAGDHSAPFHAVDFKNEGVARDEWVRTHWGDAAGIPVDMIDVDLNSLPLTDPLHPRYEEIKKLLNK